MGNATREMRRECAEMLERLKKEALKRAEEAGERVRREQQERARNQRPIPLYRDPQELIEEIDIAHRRTLADLQALVDRADQSIPQFLQEHQRLVDEVMSNGNHELTSELKDALEAKRALVQQQEQIRADAQVEMQRINEQYDAEKRSYQRMAEILKRLDARNI